MVAHTIAAVNVQMNAAVATFDADPAVARRALNEARNTTRNAVQELRATVVLLRHDTTPAPRLDDVARLAEPACAAGLAVTVDDQRSDMELSGAAEVARTASSRSRSPT